MPHPDAVLKIVPVLNSLIICERGKYFNRLDKSNDRMVVGNEILEEGNQIQDIP